MHSIRANAVVANSYFISKWLSQISHPKADDKKYVRRIAIWNFNKFGYGHVDLDEYFEYEKIRLSRRVYDLDWHELRKYIFSRDKFTCAYCGLVGGILELDHIIPMSKGGQTLENNLTTSCRKCNRQKKDKSVHEFKEWKNGKTTN